MSATTQTLPSVHPSSGRSAPPTQTETGIGPGPIPTSARTAHSVARPVTIATTPVPKSPPIAAAGARPVPAAMSRSPAQLRNLADDADAQPALDHSTSVVLGDTYVGFGGIEVSTSSLPPELEEAAILYANGQIHGCVVALRAAIVQDLPEQWQRQAWLMLLDVFQASGDREQFEALSIDFAAHFEQSPPSWREGAASGLTPEGNPTTVSVRFLNSRLDATSTRQFDQVRKAHATGRAVTLDFSNLVSCDAQGAALACEFLLECEIRKIPLAIVGANQLLALALKGIETGRADHDDSIWKLALAAHRLLGQQTKFEDLSVDYAVTYEVSPPPWEPPVTGVRLLAAGGSAGQGSAADGVYRSGAVGDAFRLVGEISGRMDAEIEALREYALTRSEILIDCRLLLRMDFSAAGELLNEVVSMATRGLTVLFIDPSSIVAALFIVMGLHEVADVRGRRD